LWQWRSILTTCTSPPRFSHSSLIKGYYNIRVSYTANVMHYMSSAGEIEISDHNYDKALEHLDAALNIYKEMKALATSGGGDMRNELHSLGLFATALCASGQWGKGLQTFRAVIERESRHVGATHHNLVQKYVNSGLCAYQGGEFREAMKLLHTGETILRGYPHLQDSPFQGLISTYMERASKALSGSSLAGRGQEL